MEHKKTMQDRPPNFRSDIGTLFLVRCFNCDRERGRENWMPVVSKGRCAWCGWKENRHEDNC